MTIPAGIMAVAFASVTLIIAFAFPSQSFEDKALTQPQDAVPYVAATVPTQIAVSSSGVLGTTRAPGPAPIAGRSLSREVEVTAVDIPPAVASHGIIADDQLPPDFAGSAAMAGVLAQRTYAVRAGDTVASIAASQYGAADFARVIRYANGLGAGSEVAAGQVLILPRVGDAPVHPPVRGPAASIQYEATQGAIVVSGSGAVATLSDIATKVPAGLLSQVGPGQWYLTASILVSHGASLSLIGKTAGGDVDWLKLKSDATGAVSLKAVDASIYMEHTRVTSWDNVASAVDTVLADGRAFVLAKGTGDTTRMDVIDSELSYLGYASGEAWGVSWRRIAPPSGHPATGTVLGSSFHDNYFGAYTFGATGMFWAGNQFFNNAVYGLDPHTGSSGFLVEYNTFSGNGKHGLIFSKQCNNNIVAFNSSSGNGLHGIVLDQGSSDNWILNNDVHDNFDGIVLFESNANALYGNNVHDNTHSGVRINGPQAGAASGNTVAFNDIGNNRAHGVQLYQLADRNVVQGNTIHGQTGAGIYVGSSLNRIGGIGALGNAVGANTRGIVVEGSTATRNLVQGNDVTQSELSGISLETPGPNFLSTNGVSSSKRSIVVTGETGSVVAFNTLSAGTVGIVLDGCTNCRLVGNTAATAADGVIQVSGSGDLLIEDQAYGDIHFRDPGSTVAVIQRDGGMVRLGPDESSYDVAGTRASRIRALVPGAHESFQRIDR